MNIAELVIELLSFLVRSFVCLWTIGWVWAGVGAGAEEAGSIVAFLVQLFFLIRVRHDFVSAVTALGLVSVRDTYHSVHKNGVLPPQSAPLLIQHEPGMGVYDVYRRCN